MTTAPLNLGDYETPEPQLTHFQSQFIGTMALYADPKSVVDYLEAHQDWFCRCAHPMTVAPLADRGYALTVGRYGSLGYEVEPRIGLELLPPDPQGIYRILTIPIPDYEPQGYRVDFRAALQLLDAGTALRARQGWTQVEWNLDLRISIQFPRFINKLPKSVVQQAGDRLLKQVVRQISQRLTTRVAADFHRTQGISLPP